MTPLRIKISAFFALIVSLVSLSSLSSTSYKTEEINTPPMQQLLQAACNRDVVMLGEDPNHGGGATILLKGEITRKLVEQCGFNAIAFESGIYDLLDFNEHLLTKSASKDILLSAQNGLFGQTQEFQETLDFTYQQAIDGKVKLLGIDSNFGNRYSQYTPKYLAKRLTQHMPVKSRKECYEALQRHNTWSYDTENPYSEKAMSHVMSCAKASVDASRRAETVISTSTKQMASSYLAALKSQQPNGFSIRDRAMFDNLLWHLKQSDKPLKTIILTANTHAAYDLSALSPKMKSLGYFVKGHFKDKVISIGITAQSGSISNFRQQKVNLEPAKLDSLEFVLGNIQNHNNWLYINSNKLRAAGNIPSFLFGFQKTITHQWNQSFDAVIALKKEIPKTAL